MKCSRKLVFAVFVTLLASTALIAQDIPVRNWTVPPIDASMFNQSGPSIRPLSHTQGDNPAVFVPLGPCRLTDSRVVSGGPGPIAGGGTRDYDFVPSGCGGGVQSVSDPILAWSLNFTVINTAGPGFLYAFPTGGTPPPVSILNYTGAAGEIRNNAAIVPVNAATGSFTVGAGVSATDVIIDTNGVFLATLEPGTTFQIISTTLADAIRGTNTYPSIGGGVGVRGESINYNGVWAQSTNQDGLAAFGGRDGGFLQGARHGVIGASVAASGATYGVIGSTTSTSGTAAGVLGSQGALAPFSYGTPLGILGRADDFNTGIVGTAENSNGWGVQGFRLNETTGAMITSGVLGYAGNSGVHSFQDVTAGGLKPFVVPYDGDAGKQIVFVAIEADEALTATRGRVHLERGLGRIQLPDHFLRVTEPEGLTVQLTPVGGMATVAVLAIDPPNGVITVQASRSIDVFYRIEGVRKGYADFKPVQENVLFVPQSASSTMPPWPESTKALLIKNGIFQENGTVNLETAHRLGWDVNWGGAATPAPRPENPTTP